MDFERLPDDVFLEIFEYLPLKQRVRIGRVSQCFYRVSLLVMSEIRSLNLYEDIFRRMKTGKFDVLFDSCSKKLRCIKFPPDLPLVFSFVQFSYPNLTEVDLGCLGIENEVFADIIGNHRKLRKVIWEYRSVSWVDFRPDFPDVVCEKLEALKFGQCKNGSLITLTGRVPNLKHFECELKAVSGEVLDDFVASCPKMEALIFREMKGNSFSFMDTVQFWFMGSLRTLIICNQRGREMRDGDLKLISMAFPHLEILELVRLHITNTGVAHLRALTRLRVLTLTCNAVNNLDDGVSALYQCRHLQIAQFDIDLTINTIRWLALFCHELRLICVYRIRFIGNARQTAAIVAQAFGDLVDESIERNLSIRVSHSESAEVWGSKEVGTVLEQLTELSGHSIRFEEGDFMWGETTLTFSG